jgi:hypothetical protein
MKKKSKDQETIESLGDLANMIGPHINRYQELTAPAVKRAQWMNFTIMMTLCISVTLLAIFKIIDASAATGLIGAIIGYVFGHIYASKRN